MASPKDRVERIMAKAADIHIFHMKAIILVSLMFPSSILMGAAQSVRPFPVQWCKTFGGTNYESAFKVAVAPDGGYAVLATSNSGISGDKTTTNYGSDDGWLVRLDSHGNKLWESDFGGADGERVLDLKASKSGGWILVGHTHSSFSGNKTGTNYGQADYWVVRVDDQGNKLWDKTFGGSSYDEANAVVEADNGDFIVAGYSRSGTSEVKTVPNFGSADIWLLRLNPQGDVVWQKNYGGMDQDWPYAIERYGTNGFVVAGASWSPPSGNKVSSNYGNADFWIIAIDQDGNKLWEQSYGGDNYDEAFKLRQTLDGGFVVFGWTLSGVSGNKTTPLAFPSFDCWIIRLDAAGQKLWERTFGHEGSDFPGGLAQTLDGGFVVTGGRSAPAGPWTLRLDPNGNQVWEHDYTPDGISSAFADIQSTPDGGLIGLGSVRTPLQLDDIILTKLGPDALTAPQLELVRPSSPAAGAATQLILRGIPGHTYVAELTSDFAIWTPFATNTLASASIEIIDATAAPQKFYRARMQP